MGITLTEASAEQLAAALPAGELDLGVIAAVEPLPPGLAAEVVLDEALVAAVAHDHPLARRTAIALADLAGPTRSSPCRAEPACAPGSTRPGRARASARASRSRRATRRCSPTSPPAGSGVAIVPESITWAAGRPKLHALAITRPALRGRIELRLAGRRTVEPGRASADSGGPGDTAGMSERNVLGGALEPCGFDPVTGCHRDGCCRTGPEDLGSHTICAVVTPEFLEHQREHRERPDHAVPQYSFPGLAPATAGA